RFSEQLSLLENSAEYHTRRKRQIHEYATRWENNKVYYYFDASINSTTQAYVRTVLKYIQARTCIDFIEDATATNRIRVFNGGGCYSSLGMVGGEQDLSLAGYCIVVGTVAHEFTHALGSLHMQSRNDRDTYITVDTTNVKVTFQMNTDITSARPEAVWRPRIWHWREAVSCGVIIVPDESKIGPKPPNLGQKVYGSQFNKATYTINNTPYEYGSDMHYGADTFTTSGNSMIPKDARYLRTLGSKTISFYDIRMINWFYKCNG
ncbi:astacin, partial [Cooperia oncophora]